MRSKVICFLLSALVLCLFLTASTVFAKDALHKKTTFKVDRAPHFALPMERPNNSSVQQSDIPLNSKFSPAATASPGYQAGLTTYDYQHNGAMGRMIAFSYTTSVVHFVWMAQDDFEIPGNRRVYYQGFNALTSMYSETGAGLEASIEYSGYASCQTMPDGSAMFGCHEDPQEGFYYSHRYYDDFPPHNIFAQDKIEYSNSALETIWPIIGAHSGDSVGVTTDVIYMLTHVFEGSEDMIFYRKVSDGVGGWLDWEEHYLETITNLAYTIAPDPNSDNVAVVFTDDRTGEEEGSGGQTDVDIYYMLSTNQGASWGTPVNVSNYTEDSLWRAYSDVSAMYSSIGNLHIIWSARELRSATVYENYKCRLVHWSSASGIASIIDEARYEMDLNGRDCDPGAWNMYIAKMSISECDGNVYALYTKFGDDNEPGALSDCSQKGFANGELYITASDDWGVTWDTAVNMTNSRNTIAQPDGCDSAECESDHWSSMARYGMIYAGADDTLDIMYINDKDAGGIPQGEGTWCINNVMHLRIPCRPVVHIPKISFEPTSFGDPLHTLPGDPVDVTLKISNIGNANLNISNISVNYIDGSGWMSIGTYDATIIPGSFTSITITMNAGGVLTTPDPSGWDADILIDHDAPSDVDIIPVHLTVATDFYIPYPDTVETTNKFLIFENTGRLGGDNDGYSLDIPGDCDGDATSPNGDMYLYDASPAIAWNDGTDNLTYTAVFTQIFTEDGTFRPQSDISVGDSTDYTHYEFTASTTDSIYAVDVDLYAPIDGNDFLIAAYEFYAWNPTKDNDEVYVGMVLDWDIPADDAVDNGSGKDEVRNMLWQRGAQTDDADELDGCPIEEQNRNGGVRLLSGAPATAWTAENAPMQSGSGFDPDSLYNRMAGSGYNIIHDAAYTNMDDDTLLIDLHTGMTFDKIDLSGSSSKRFVVAIATTNDDNDDFVAQMDAAMLWADAHGLLAGPCDCVPGDANADGGVNVGDAVYVIGYVFSGGSAPTPYPICSGDANGDCGTNVGDAVYVIGYVFSGGEPPVDCDTWAGACGALQK